MYSIALFLLGLDIYIYILLICNDMDHFCIEDNQIIFNIFRRLLQMWASGAFDFIYGLPLYLIYCIFYSVNGEWMRLGVDLFNNEYKSKSTLVIGHSLRIWLLHYFHMTAGLQKNQLIK